MQALAGGESRVQPDVLLSAGGGQISGVVTDGKAAVGGVTVTTSVGGQAVSVITPTTGAVGVYTLADLPTPGTYLISFSAEGFGTRSRIVRLGAGESRLQEDQSLASGTGSITGTVVGPDKQGLGGVSVSVGGTAAVDGSVPATTTLTDGAAAGTFVLDDLPTGTYALTFTKDGFAPVTLPVTLEEEGPGEEVRLQMGALVGTIEGVVEGPSDDGPVGFVGATVTATNGTTTNTATSSSAGGGLAQGGFLLPSLPPGWYSVTVTAPGRAQMTALVEVVAGKVARTRLFLEEDR